MQAEPAFPGIFQAGGQLYFVFGQGIKRPSFINDLYAYRFRSRIQADGDRLRGIANKSIVDDVGERLFQN